MFNSLSPGAAQTQHQILWEPDSLLPPVDLAYFIHKGPTKAVWGKEKNHPECRWETSTNSSPEKPKQNQQKKPGLSLPHHVPL